jgi:hypothetical protein
MSRQSSLFHYLPTLQLSEGKPSLIAIVQMTATSNKADNFAVTKKKIEEASSLGAKVNEPNVECNNQLKKLINSCYVIGSFSARSM